MKFYEPKTISVSLTGKKCSLMCDHCRGHYLETMNEISDIKECEGEDLSFLISGGFNKQGCIPLYANKEFLQNLKTKGKLNIHPGFLDARDIGLLQELDPVVSLDFTQDPKVIGEIYHLPYTSIAYPIQYKQLVNAGLKVVPHICLGLGESDEETLDVIAKLNPGKVVLLIFRPTRNTPLKDKEPPTLERLETLFRRFRSSYSGEIILGCMRPGGEYRVKCDTLAYEIGFDGIVKPAKPLKDEVGPVETSMYCCAF